MTRVITVIDSHDDGDERYRPGMVGRRLAGQEVAGQKMVEQKVVAQT